MTTTVPTLNHLKKKPRSSTLQQLAKTLVLRKLSAIHDGQIRLAECFRSNDAEENHQESFSQVFGHGNLVADIKIHDPAFYAELAFGGSVGAGEAYMLGYWSCAQLTDLVRIISRNADVMDNLEEGLAILSRPLLKLMHRMNRNNTSGSQRNIAAHYDLGNALFALFLDPTMMYSCAIFSDPGMTLEQASRNKLDIICRKLALSPQDHVIEIGTGWGGFALHAATHYGCKVTTTTISQAQYALAQSRINAAGLQDRINIVLKDYRELEGQYDKLVSIEMIEAVGHQFYDTYFAKCASLLKADGMALIQAITIADQRYEQAKNAVDFIQKYIFPGSCIPSVTAMLDSITRSSDLRLGHLEDYGLHYARTLALWREKFLENESEVLALGYPDTFIRMWEFYLCYCEGGFAERALGDVHLLLQKPQNRRDPCDNRQIKSS